MSPRTIFITAILALTLANALPAHADAQAETTTPPIPGKGIILPQPPDQTLSRTYFAGTFIPHVFGYFIAGFGAISLIFFLIGGVMLLVSYGNDDTIKKATQTMQYAVVGFVIALLAYSVVVIINNLAGTLNPQATTQPAAASQIFTIETAYAQIAATTTPLKQIISTPPPASEVSGLPSRGDILGTTGKGIIQLILKMSGLLFFVALVVSAVMMIVSRGNDEELKKAKNAITYSVVGLVAIAMSYAVFFGIAELNFFSDSTPT